jgi:hypothetical protein
MHFVRHGQLFQHFLDIHQYSNMNIACIYRSISHASSTRLFVIGYIWFDEW